MGWNRRLFLVVTVMVLGCAQKRGPCAAEMDALEFAHADRMHGLTQNDDLHEALERMQAASACVTPAQRPTLFSHAQLLAWRMEAAGNSDGLLQLARIFSSSPDTHVQDRAEGLRTLVKRADGAKEKLEAHALQLRDEATHHPEEKLRAQLAMEAAGLEPAQPFPVHTTLLITHASSVESCVMVFVGRDMQPGVGVISVLHHGVALPLHGDSPALQIGSKPVRSRVCTSTAIADGDLLKIYVNGMRAYEALLHPSVEDEARGAAVLATRVDGTLPDACAHATHVDSRAACALLGSQP